MYALVICLDNIKRIVPTHYIQRREENGSIAVYIPDKQRFCSAVVLDRSDTKEILVEKMAHQLQDRHGTCTAKRKPQQSSPPASSPASPASKRLRGPSLGTDIGCRRLDLQSLDAGSTVQEHCFDEQGSERWSAASQIKEECPEDEQWEHDSRDANSIPSQNDGNIGHRQPPSAMAESENALSLGNDISLTRLLCEVLQDQRALARRVQEVEGTLQQILETVSKTHQVIAGQGQQQQRVDVTESPPAGPSQDEDSCSDYNRSDDGQSEGQLPNNQPIKLEEIDGDTQISESCEQDCPSSDSSFRTVHVHTGTDSCQAGNSAALQCSLSRPGRNIDGITTMNPSTAPHSFEKSRLRILHNDFVVIPVLHQEFSPDVSNPVLPPVLIPSAEYRNILLKNKTPTAFCRTLLKFFFSDETLKSHNFTGGPVRTKLGKVVRGQLNRRLVLSMIDQVELEFPGSTKGRENMKLLKKAINDKCNHM